jgi:FHA domain
MDIVGKARKLERKIARSLDAAVVELAGKSGPAPLEIVHAVLERAEHEIQEAGRGVRVFPFNKVKVVVVAAPGDKGARARFDAVVDGPPSLAERLQGRLRAAGCRTGDVAVDVAYVKGPGANWESREFNVEFERVAAAAPTGIDSAVPALKLTVVAGKAARRAQVFSGGRIDIGRRSEVLDAKQRVVRTNHIAFDDGPEENRSVSRRHAHVTFHPGTGEYRLQDDRSEHGTSILRRGRTIAVPAGSRGVRIESGDEIIVGQARLKATVG